MVWIHRFAGPHESYLSVHCIHSVNCMIWYTVVFLPGELMGRTGGAEKLCLDESLLSDSKLQGWHTLSVSRTLITEMGFDNCGSKFLMKFV